MRKALLLVVAVVGFAAITGFTGTGKALAYGSADQPIAQVEISGNCNNPSFPLCQEVGLGGVWSWAELDTAGGSAAGGSMDYTLTFCGHTGPGGGAHSAGAFGHPGEGRWYRVDTLGDAFGLGSTLTGGAGASPFFDTSVAYDGYYVLDYFPGSGSGDFVAIVPAPYGHYGLNPVSAVAIQTTVAP
jgi:hypothetical protein